MIINLKSIVIAYWLAIIGLFFYSYTQVDLNLTLSQWSIWQVIQKFFQNIGWFQRPLSTAIYIVIFLLLTACYLLLLWLIKKNKVNLKQLWLLIIPTGVILLFSYNAFSYDLFNYMFDARIFTVHNENPYLHKALDYPGDPWINFMRWTHRAYPYGPVWLGFTIPLSYLGFQFFLPTLFLYKALMAASFLGTIYFIGKILEKISPQDKLFGMALFAFNPLVIIESLVSAHNDIVMIFLSVGALYYLLSSKYVRAFLLLFLSFGVKFATIVLLPVFLLVVIQKTRKLKTNWRVIFIVSLIAMTISIIAASVRTELQSWYLLWLLPLTALLTREKWAVITAIIIPFGLLLHYIPFIYSGNWDPPIPTIKLWLTAGSIALTVFIIALTKISRGKV